MTWIIGGRHAFCARALADIQVTVTWDDKSRPTQYVDAVKKIYVLHDGLVIAFSGTIRIAFEVIEWLKQDCIPALTDNLFSEPDEIARRVIRHVKYAFQKAREKESERVNFLLFVLNKASMYRSVGIYKLCAPDFTIQKPRNPFELLEIGTGSEVEEYRNIVVRHSVPGYLVDDPDSDLPAMVIPTGRVALKYLQAEAAEFQKAGISRAMNLMLMYSGGTTIIERPSDPEIPFPRVAESWDELVRFLASRGIELEACNADA